MLLLTHALQQERAALRPTRARLPHRRLTCCAPSPLVACRSWVERVVIGLSLCPWARPAHDAGGIHFAQTDASSREGVYLSLYTELQTLAAGVPPDVPETSIVVAPNAFQDDFLELCAVRLRPCPPNAAEDRSRSESTRSSCHTATR